MKPALILERALFVVAPGDSGKSTQLRSMFRDRRLGTNGRIPPSSEAPKLPEIYYLSNERRLYLRLTSPHEYKETPSKFLTKTRRKMGSGRWCFACPFQPNAFRNMPDILDSVLAFVRAFDPERVRVVFLSPNRHGVELEEYLPDWDIRTELLRIDGVEVACIDAREREANGLFLADFFDFT
jgi:hypothetical protein